MNKLATASLAGAALALSIAAADAKGKVVGVSWSNFQEERWKTDEAAMKAAIAAAGDKYISADAQSSAQKQLADIESMIAQGANVLIVLAQDSSAIAPAVKKAVDEGIPVIGYDRLIENPNAFYITFDNKEVGRMQARAVFAVKPAGNYAFIKGSSTDPNADFLFSGQIEVLKDAMTAGKIKNAGEAYTDGWLPANAQKNMEQILTKNDNKVDAVVASNDGTAGGAIAALSAQGMAGAVPVSGQDGDHAALNRVALGTQTVSVWKDARELGKSNVGFLVLAGLGKHHGVFKSHAGFTGLLVLPPFIAAPRANTDNDEDTAGDNKVAVTLPQLLQPFAAYFLVNFLEYVGHELKSPTPARSAHRCPGNNPARASWRQSALRLEPC